MLRLQRECAIELEKQVSRSQKTYYVLHNIVLTSAIFILFFFLFSYVRQTSVGMVMLEFRQQFLPFHRWAHGHGSWAYLLLDKPKSCVLVFRSAATGCWLQGRVLKSLLNLISQRIPVSILLNNQRKIPKIPVIIHSKNFK